MSKVFRFFICYFIFSTLNLFASEGLNEVAFVRDFFNQIVSVAKNNKLNKVQKEARCIEITESILDFDWNAKMALGVSFRKFNENEQKEYLQAYKNLLISKWLPKIYNIDNLVEIQLDDRAVKISDSDHLVKMKLFYREESTKKIKSLDADIRLRNFQDTKKILNIIVENVDLALSYRSDFSSIIEKKGMQEFLKELKAKNLK